MVFEWILAYRVSENEILYGILEFLFLFFDSKTSDLNSIADFENPIAVYFLDLNVQAPIQYWLNSILMPSTYFFICYVYFKPGHVIQTKTRDNNTALPLVEVLVT